MADPRPMPWGDTDKPKAVRLPHSTKVLGIRRIAASCHMATNNIAGGVYGYIFRGRRYDTGDKLDYIKAIVRLALQRDDLGPLLEQWLDVESHRRK